MEKVFYLHSSLAVDILRAAYDVRKTAVDMSNIVDYLDGT